MSVILFIIILGILVFAHELGHFLAAKKFGIRVDEFAVGFPPRLFSKKIGETFYSVNAVPIGGYVKIYGEDGDEEKGELASETKIGVKMSSVSRWKQAVILSAGVFGNLVFAWFLLSIGFMAGLPTSQGGPFADEIRNQRLVITATLPASPAEMSGLKSGDQILSLKSGDKILSEPNGEKASLFISALPAGSALNVDVMRKKTAMTFSLAVKEGIVLSGKSGIGIAMEDAGILQLSPLKAVVAGGYAAANMTKSVAVGIVGMLRDIFVGQVEFSSLTGPVGIAIMVGDAEKLGLLNLLLLTVIISINLAVINVLPFPALDGGRLFFLGIESIIRRPLNQKFARATNQVGFILLLFLMAIITYKDIIKLIK